MDTSEAIIYIARTSAYCATWNSNGNNSVAKAMQEIREVVTKKIVDDYNDIVKAAIWDGIWTAYTTSEDIAIGTIAEYFKIIRSVGTNICVAMAEFNLSEFDEKKAANARASAWTAISLHENRSLDTWISSYDAAIRRRSRLPATG